MIRTSSHKNWNSKLYTTYAISGNRGLDANYHGNCFKELAPKITFWKVWHENIGIISEEENNRYYIEQYYLQVLSKLDPEDIYQKLDNSVLLCYEETDQFCHRHIVAEWFQLLLDIHVPEIKMNENNIEELERPTYIKIYLEEAIKKNKNMKDFKSLRALYLFEKAEKFELKANQLYQETGQFDNQYRYNANQLKREAEEIEKCAKRNVKTLNRQMIIN